jgi:hypothetical protein
MRVGPLLAAMTDDELGRLALEHVRTDERPPRPQLCSLLESVVRSYRFVHDFVINRQPPTFAILTIILDSTDYQISVEGFRDRVLAETERIASGIASGDLVSRKDQLRLYRRALYEARRNDLDLNTSESALLAVLRREDGIAQVEHFVVEHHQDFREFWDRPDSFEHEMNALKSAGLVFQSESRLIVPSDVAPAVWQTLGIDMPTESARRLYGFLSGSETAEILEASGTRSSGSKEAKLDRMLLERIQPRFALGYVALSTLREICRATEAPLAGNKDELIERVIAHFALGKDQQVEDTVDIPRIEERTLAEGRFVLMFGTLQHQELTDILRRHPNLRQTGTKERRIQTLWESHLSEKTLLSELMNRQLEDLLHRTGLRLSGSKDARIERLIEHFAGTATIVSPTENLEAEQVEHIPHTPIVLKSPADPKTQMLREEFSRRASNPQASLQPWLDELLNANGNIRCYATEDANPTKQLKNKLSQAASAREGLLVLILAAADPFEKAKEALLERWMSNDEWPKSVSAVALGYPFGDCKVHSIIQRTRSELANSLRSRIFPDAEILDAVSPTGESREISRSKCVACGTQLTESARFCSSCGARVEGS